nr:DUF559 domain-containing protein [Sphingobium lactosutens]
MIWKQLSRYRPRFTRQLVVGPYIVDMACRTAKLALEFDGSQHGDAQAYDAHRTAFLEEAGWTVLRFWNSDVFENLDGVLSVILNKTAECLGGAHPQPSTESRASVEPFREGRRRAD